MTRVARNTVAKLLTDIRAACVSFRNRTLVNLTTKRIECDETSSFDGMKEKQVPAERRAEFGVGDVSTWTAIDADSKLCVSWLVAERDSEGATMFMKDVAFRLANRVQLSTDGHKPYLVAVGAAFAGEIDYAQVVKKYGTPGKAEERRYGPANCCGIEKTDVCGNPMEKLFSTSDVERQNLSMRMGKRQITRLTNAVSKKAEAHRAAINLYFMHYNFARRHATLKTSPAVKAGIADHVWTIEEIVALLYAEISN